MLWTHAQAPADLVHVEADVVAVHISRAGRRREQARQDRHGGGLARAVVA